MSSVISNQREVFLVFDTETTGLPQYTAYRGYHDPRKCEFYDSARLLSISWILVDAETLDEVESSTYFVRPDGFSIPESSVMIHGISEEIAAARGKPVAEVLADLMDVFNAFAVRSLVAHNICFDVNIVASECYRCADEFADLAAILLRKKQFCTMRRGRAALALSKNPKLSELYRTMYGEDITNAHDAEFDTRYCCKCFQALMRIERGTPAAAAADSTTDAANDNKENVRPAEEESSETFQGAITRSRSRAIAEVTSLNASQRHIVASDCVPGGSSLIMACAGSGKTTTVVQRIRFLVQEYSVPEHKIILTTFTNHAAAEMQRRLTCAFGYKPDVLVGTFDSLALIILGRHARGGDAIVADATTAAATGNNVAQTRSVGEYSSELLAFLRDTGDGRAFIADCCGHVFVDEFQDVNDVQFEIVREFHRGGASITCVGDIAQNIYTFRDSNVSYMRDFESHFPGATVFTMAKNYRSSARIVDLANAVVSRMETGGLQMESAAARASRTADPRPTVRCFGDQHRQCVFVMDAIRRAINSAAAPLPPGEIAVLCPHNRYLFNLEELLTRHGIPNVVLDHGNSQHAQDRVCLSTIHKAKGLEWHTVFMIMLHDDVLPISRSNASEIEEGRRLFYVGVTRAKERLHMLFAPMYDVGGSARMSRYLSELQESNVVEFCNCQSRHYFTAALPRKRALLQQQQQTVDAGVSRGMPPPPPPRWSSKDARRVIADMTSQRYASLRRAFGGQLLPDDLSTSRRSHVLVYDYPERVRVIEYVQKTDMAAELAAFVKLLIQKECAAAGLLADGCRVRSLLVEEMLGSVFLDFDERMVFDRLAGNFACRSNMRLIGQIIKASNIFRKRAAVVSAFLRRASDEADSSSVVGTISSEDMGIVLRILRKIERKSRCMGMVFSFEDIRIVPHDAAFSGTRLPGEEATRLSDAYGRLLSGAGEGEQLFGDMAVVARAEAFFNKRRRSVLYKPLLDMATISPLTSVVRDAFVTQYLAAYCGASAISFFARSHLPGSALWSESFAAVVTQADGQRQRLLDVCVTDGQSGSGGLGLSFEDLLHGLVAKQLRESCLDTSVEGLAFFNPLAGVVTQVDVASYPRGADLVAALGITADRRS